MQALQQVHLALGNHAAMDCQEAIPKMEVKSKGQLWKTLGNSAFRSSLWITLSKAQP